MTGKFFSIFLAAAAVFAGSGSASFEQNDFDRMRERMVRSQLAARDISDRNVLEAMGKIPRHLFVPPRYRMRAYGDYALPIAEGQTISQPYIVALMTQCLELKGGERILEVGTGSGYQAAVLSFFTDEVYTVEIRENLADEASDRLERLGYGKIHCRWSDGYFGWKEFAPYDAIIVTCAANHVPPPLLEQLKEGGRLVIPLGSTLHFQTLTVVTKTAQGPVVDHISGVRFVPMTGEMQKKKR